MKSIMFAKRLKSLRIERKISQDKLAKDLGTSKTTISNYENGLRIPDADFIIKVARYFRISTDYLLGVRDEQNYVTLNPENTIIASEALNAFDKTSIPSQLKDFFTHLSNTIQFIEDFCPNNELYFIQSLDEIASYFSELSLWIDIRGGHLEECFNELVEKDVSRSVSVGTALAFAAYSDSEYNEFLKLILDNTQKAKFNSELELYHLFEKMFKDKYKENYNNFDDSINIYEDYKWIKEKYKCFINEELPISTTEYGK